MRKNILAGALTVVVLAAGVAIFCFVAVNLEIVAAVIGWSAFSIFTIGVIWILFDYIKSKL